MGEKERENKVKKACESGEEFQEEKTYTCLSKWVTPCSLKNQLSRP
jgi:hypothetical protein